MTACAGVVILLLLLSAPSVEEMEADAASGESTPESRGWAILCQAAIIAIACLANLASSAMKISIQKDWIVVVSGD